MWQSIVEGEENKTKFRLLSTWLTCILCLCCKKKKVSKLRARLFKKFQLIRSNVQKYKNAIWSNNSTSGHISKKNWKQGLRQILVHSHLDQHYSQWPKSRSNSSVHRQMNGQTNFGIFNGILSSLKKERNSKTWCNMAEPWKHYAMWKKSDRKGQILYGSTYMRYLK